MSCAAPELFTPEADATRVNPLPARSSMTLENEAIPAASVTVDNVPERIGRFGTLPVPRVTITPGTAAPMASKICIRTGGEIGWPAVVGVGWVMNWIWAPAGTVFVMAMDSGCVKVCGGKDWSNATTVQLNVPVCVVVPLITPCKSMARPGGKVLE